MSEQITNAVLGYLTFLRLVDNDLANTFSRVQDVLITELKADIKSLSISTVHKLPIVYIEYIVNGHNLCISVRPQICALCKVPSTYKGKRTIIVEKFSDTQLAEHFTCLIPVAPILYN